MRKILFVCHGNICRSPMAEYVMKDMLKKAGLTEKVYVASAATSREELGSPVYPPARRELNAHGITCEGHRARQIQPSDLEEFDDIYYMDARNARNLQKLFPDVTIFRPFLDRDVADPWYTGEFSQTWEDVCEGCRRILEELR